MAVPLRLVSPDAPLRAALRGAYDEIVGDSPVLIDALRLVDRVASTDVPVLLSGESGSGKELFARAIHAHGARRDRAFMVENCGAIPEPLLESTLFGHARGAFTGAVAHRVGLFELADRGTLFLDEIGEMSVGMQTKLLRVLQDGEVRPVGGATSRKVDVRIVAATHRDLRSMVLAGTFREDLFYRLRVVELRVPALRERPSDVPRLVQHFLAKHAPGERPRFTEAAMAALASFAWPGNVRQLENEVRRAVVLADAVIDQGDLSPEIARPEPRSSRESGEHMTLRARVDALEAELIRGALERSSGNQTRAAELLGLSRFGLQKMIKRLGVEHR